MTQPPPHAMSPQGTRDQKEMDAGSQMEWFVMLGGTQNFVTMKDWEQLKWKEEFAEMYLRANEPVNPVHVGMKRYPRAKDETPRSIDLPTLEQMQDVRDKIASHLNELADGVGTYLGPFQINFSVKFKHVHDAYGRQDIPRHCIYRVEMGQPTTNIFQANLLRYMARLLEIYCDQIRRCPRPSCQRVFLQNRRHQEYCDRRCQSVAVMQKRRTEEKEKSKKGPIDKKPVLKTSIKGGGRHGTKRR